MQLFNTVIDDNDFIVYALFILEKTHGPNLEKLRDIFDIFEINVKRFFDIVSFKDYFNYLEVDDLHIPNML